MRKHLPLWLAMGGVSGFRLWAIFVMATTNTWGSPPPTGRARIGRDNSARRG